MKKAIRSFLLSETTYSVLISGLLLCIPLRYAFSSIAVIVLTAVSFFRFFFTSQSLKKLIGPQSFYMP